MRALVFLAFTLFINAPAFAADAPPPAVASAPKADIKKLKAEIGQLSENQKRDLLGHIRKQLPKATEAEKDAKDVAMRQRWQQMKPEERAEYRAKYAASWSKLTSEEKTIQREKIAERLRALPDVDRDVILQSVKTKP